MRDISRASGVSQPLIHHYFRSKRDLYNEIAQDKPTEAKFLTGWLDRVDALQSAITSGSL